MHNGGGQHLTRDQQLAEELYLEGINSDTILAGFQRSGTTKLELQEIIKHLAHVESKTPRRRHTLVRKTNRQVHSLEWEIAQNFFQLNVPQKEALEALEVSSQVDDDLVLREWRTFQEEQKCPQPPQKGWEQRVEGALTAYGLLTVSQKGHSGAIVVRVLSKLVANSLASKIN